MSVHERKARERANRHKLIVSTARELAETHGWDAVTTRRLAERIEYSQPVLYSHFRSRNEIVGAVALEGFAELTAALRAAVPEGPVDREAVTALAHAYTDFAERNHALYDAMFSLDNGLPFADEATPAPCARGTKPCWTLSRTTRAPMHRGCSSRRSGRRCTDWSPSPVPDACPPTKCPSASPS
ncbi:hypothetical protein SSPO_080430 [Streptomyces antimycoticus]|uniref:HTH tetR-type domain-containing protein n=1 Tax=Streptomyces antimycoticus TaxID=68175 RepID=A0A499UT48_9ACTN|nr:hypothetical protein SSPO_080430 [Streptomyces antimycoticus]